MISATEQHAARMRARVDGPFGHPRGLVYLLAVEGFWAFAFFGLQMMLTLYMTRRLLAPGHAQHIWGFDVYRRMLEGGGPALGAVDIASQTFGFMTSASYALPLLGALVADRWLGARRTMVIGLAFLTAAMATLVFEQGFLVGAGLLIVGNGLLKCNLWVAIGGLYATDDPRRTGAFAYTLIAANIGSFITPLVSGTLAERVSFQFAITTLAVAMACALAAVILGRHHIEPLAPRAPMAATAGKPAPLARRDLMIALVLVAVLVPEVVHFGAYQQTFNVFPLWAADHADRTVFGFEFPVTWFNTVDGLLTIAGAAAAVRIWGSQTARGRPMGDLSRIAVGCALGLVGFLILALASIGGGKAPLVATLGYFLFLDPAISWVDTVTCALISRAAPASINSTMMAVYTLSTAGAYYITGQLGRLYEHVSPAAFWAAHAGLDVGCLAFLALAGPAIARTLAGGGEAEPAPAG